MLEVGRRLDLDQEAPGAHDRRQLGPQHLERDPAVVAFPGWSWEWEAPWPPTG